MKIKTPMSLLVGVFFSLKLNLGPKIRSDIGNLPVSGAEPRSGEAQNGTEKREYSIVLNVLDKIRTFFRENPDAEF